MESIRMTVGQALVRFLAAQWTERDGVRCRTIPGVWAIFGHGNVAGLGQALEELGAEVGLPTYRAQNEQAMVHAAAAYAKHRHRLATFACTASVGPGSANMITAAAGATVNRLPVLLLPGDLFANRRNDPVLQQLEHPTEHDLSVNDAFRPVARFYTRIARPEQLLSALPEAMRVLTDPVETGAVVVALPEDVQAEAFGWPAALFEPRTWRVRRPPPEPEAIAQAVRWWRRARRPLVVAGGGAIYAEASGALAGFAERFGVPVAETQAGKGALAWDHPMNVGPVGTNGGSAANALAREADLVLAVGTRLSDFTTASMTAFQRPDVRFVGLNVSPFDAHKLGALGIVADARSGLEALAAALSGEPAAASSGSPPAAAFAGTGSGFRAEVADLKHAWDATVDDLRRVRPNGAFGQAEVIGIVNEVVGGDAVVVNAAGSMPGDLLKLWRPTHPQAYHLEYGFSCMGYEIPAGIGVKLAEPGREVVVFVGDGSYLMMNSEIVTAVAEGLAFTIVLVDNGGYQSIHGLQRSVGSPPFGNERRARDPGTGRLDGPVVAVDFLRHAEAMGALALYAADESALRRALEAARASARVSVVVVPTDPERRVPGFGGWWDVPVAQASGQAGVNAARAVYDLDVTRQREHRAVGAPTLGAEEERS
jgi:3D-(3,5/4)-trihydroxycyclohexane-1,2-dione acylhydrolase (decyclizing)